MQRSTAVVIRRGGVYPSPGHRSRSDKAKGWPPVKDAPTKEGLRQLGHPGGGEGEEKTSCKRMSSRRGRGRREDVLQENVIPAGEREKRRRPARECHPGEGEGEEKTSCKRMSSRRGRGRREDVLQENVIPAREREKRRRPASECHPGGCEGGGPGSVT